MISRRHTCSGLAVAGAVAALPRLASADSCQTRTRANPHGLSPAQAIDALRQGNDRFLAGITQNCDLLAQVEATAGGQAPFAAVLGCMDSRVPPELVFDQKIGDIFDIRIAGNFADTAIIGSMEFATVVSGATAIVVLGHSGCGAVRGAIDRVELGNLTQTLSHIQPAVDFVAPEGGSSSDAVLVQEVAEVNVGIAVAALHNQSPLMAALVAEGKLMIVGAMHDIATGQVTFLQG